MQKNRFFDLCPKFWHGFYDVPIRAIPQATPYCLTYKYIFPIKSHQLSAPLYFHLQIYITARRRRDGFEFLSPIAVGYAQPQ